MKTKLLTAMAVLSAALITVSNADTVFLNGNIGPGDTTFHHPNQSTAGSGVSWYDLFPFTVDVTGTYVFEAASVNSVGTPSNALDTFFAVYANTFNPAAPGAGQAFNDDFTGNRTVLPGPYAANGVTVASTGFTGANPGSRLATLSLVAGTQYFLVMSSFRDTTFVATTGTTAQAQGAYYLGLNGPGVISVVPEPSTVALLGLAAAACGLQAWRKRKAA